MEKGNVKRWLSPAVSSVQGLKNSIFLMLKTMQLQIFHNLRISRRPFWNSDTQWYVRSYSKAWV